MADFHTVTVGLYTTIFFLTAFSSSIQMSGEACHVLQAPLPIARFITNFMMTRATVYESFARTIFHNI